MARIGIGIGIGKGRQGSLLNYTKRLKNLFDGSIVAMYPMNETEGIVATDIVNGLNGKYSGVVLNQEGISKDTKSVALDTNTDFINLYSSAFNSAINKSEGSFGFWFNLTEEFIALAGTTYFFSLYISETNQLYVRKVNSSLSFVYMGGGINKFISIIPITSGWHYYVGTWSYANGRIRNYLDGKFINEATGIGNLTGNIYYANACIGNIATNATNAIKGNISTAMILNKEASATEVYNSFLKNANVVFEGDSRTTVDYKYPELCLSSITSKHYYRTNNSVSGSSIEAMGLRGVAVDSMIKTDTKNVIIVWCGVNNSAQTSQQIYDLLKSYCLNRKATGFRVVLCTEIDAQDAPRITNGWTAKYLALNTLIRNDHAFADIIADLGARTELQDANNTTYFVDKVHPTIAASRIIAQEVAVAINSIT